MKKSLLTTAFLSAMLFSNNIYAVCSDSTINYYQVNNSKVIKNKGYATFCGNMDGVSQKYEFKDNVTLEVTEKSNSKTYAFLNTKKAKKVKKPTGVPKSYTCYSIAQSKGNVYCVE